jgi:hypothetical protein
MLRESTCKASGVGATGLGEMLERLRAFEMLTTYLNDGFLVNDPFTVFPLQGTMTSIK